MSDFLHEMAARSRERGAQSKSRMGVAAITSQAASARPVLPLALATPGFDLIAETKLASPSHGHLVADDRGVASVLPLARGFAAAGAAAVSVLTEPSRFSGSLEHLHTVAAALEVPVIRKDFLVDPFQVLEARAAGASGVLLIARLVDQSLLVDLAELAISLGMFALVEVFEPADLEAASALFGHDIVVGVNGRDLSTLDIDRHRLAEMAPLLPRHLPAVAESGILSPQDAGATASLGYRAALVGTGLVTSRDPASTVREMLRAGRASVPVEAEF